LKRFKEFHSATAPETSFTKASSKIITSPSKASKESLLGDVFDLPGHWDQNLITVKALKHLRDSIKVG
jgi:hypothetical protein